MSGIQLIFVSCRNRDFGGFQGLTGSLNRDYRILMGLITGIDGDFLMVGSLRCRLFAYGGF